MSIALTSDHLDLAGVIRDFGRHVDMRAEARAALDDQGRSLPRFWTDLAKMGLLGLHIPEEHGGTGAGLVATAVSVQELSQVLTPGPFLATSIASAILTAAADSHAANLLLSQMAEGKTIATIALGAGVTGRDGLLSGQIGPVLSAGYVDRFIVEVTTDAGIVLVVVEGSAPGVEVIVPANTDPTRPAGVLSLTDVAYDLVADVVPVPVAYARAIARTLAAADAAGIARQTLEDAVAYAKVREQFNRPIGSFQAIKHRCADMLLFAEEAEAAVWGAARAWDAQLDQFSLLAAGAIHTAVSAACRNAQNSLQIHGGIGFTWEHDAHLFLRRAMALSAIYGPENGAADASRMSMEGTLARLTIDLPVETESQRSEVRQVVQEMVPLSAAEQRRRFVDTGFLMPHWPKPWGLAAAPGLQLLIDEELEEARIDRPSVGVASPFLLLSVIQHGTSEQVERWIPPVLEGQEIWCQLFSEPGAGSDAAAVRTRGQRVEGGWILNGQKVWSSHAHRARWGMATVRTDTSVPKHRGITMMVIDMQSLGVEVRPLRQITGQADFNETFLTDVFVPDDCVIGEPGEGWSIARNTLGNERVTIGNGSGAGPSIEQIIDLARKIPADSASSEKRGANVLDAVLSQRFGEHVARDIALRQLNFRRAQRSVSGGRPAAEGAVTKLLGGLHGQSGAELEVAIAGRHAFASQTPASQGIFDVLSTQRLTIAGGTAEITRNQISERILGLPREAVGLGSQVGG